MTYQQPFVIDKHDALLRAMDWGFVAALAVVGILVILGPSSPLSFPAAGEVVPRLVIAYIAAHSSLQWGAWFIDLSNALCTAVAPADPFPLTSAADLGTAFALLGLALLYGFMALFLSLFMFARVQLLAVLLMVAPLAAVLWVLPGRPRQWAELWMDLFFSNLFVQFLQVLTLNFGVGLMKTAGGDTAGFLQFLEWRCHTAAGLPNPGAGIGRGGRRSNELPGPGGAVPWAPVHGCWQAQPGCATKSQPRRPSRHRALLGRRPGIPEPPSEAPSARSGSRWPTRRPARAARAAGRAVGSVASRVHDETVVRRGV